MAVEEKLLSPWTDSKITIQKHIINLDQLILIGILITIFFMPLHEKLKAAGFWMTLAFWLTKLVRERDKQKLWIPPLAWAMLFFVGVAFLSAIFSDYDNRATRGALDALRNTIFFLILIHSIDTYPKIKYVLLSLMGGIVLGDLAGIYKYFSIGPELEMLSLGDKNSTAQVLAMFLAVLLGLILSLKREYLFKSTLILVTGLTGFVLVLTYARGIWLAILAMLIIVGLIRLDWKALLAIILLVGTVWIGMSFSERLTQKVATLKSPFTEANMVGRYEIWRESLEIIKDRPLLGIGLKTYGLPQVTHKYHLVSASHAHNMFLNVAVETGLTGLVALIACLIFYFYAIIRMRIGMDSGMRQGLWLGGLGCLVVLLVGGITHPMLGSESSLMLMTVLGLMFAAFRIENGTSVEVAASLFKMPGGKRWRQ